jgi:hypothetical protein
MTQVRAKFRVSLVTPYLDTGGQASGWRINLTPVYDANPESENGQFYKQTPWGDIVLGTVNPKAAESFHSGAEMYVDFTPVNQAE